MITNRSVHANHEMVLRATNTRPSQRRRGSPVHAPAQAQPPKMRQRQRRRKRVDAEMRESPGALSADIQHHTLTHYAGGDQTTTAATIKGSGRGASQGDAVSSYGDGMIATLPSWVASEGKPLQMILSFVFCSQRRRLMLFFNWPLQYESHY